MISAILGHLFGPHAVHIDRKPEGHRLVHPVKGCQCISLVSVIPDVASDIVRDSACPIRFGRKKHLFGQHAAVESLRNPIGINCPSCAFKQDRPIILIRGLIAREMIPLCHQGIICEGSGLIGVVSGDLKQVGDRLPIL
ncbi:hypothetical protein D1872_227690 [compost metagenome]